jgi:transcriptional regulator with XRE-family HTH domain
VSQSTEAVIRERVRALLKARPDVNQADFGTAVGRGYSWVSAFLSGGRNANDIVLLVRIARFFGVTVGYLIGETDKKIDPEAAILLAAFEQLQDKKLARSAVLQLAQTLAAAEEP